MGQLLYAACQCSSYIYDPVMQSDADLIPIMSRTPSVTGTEKAACIWKMGSTNSLIVSIRGTASAADHMVNLNGQPTDASVLLGTNAGVPVQTHKGFLSCAETLLPAVIKDLVRLVRGDTAINRIIFTGHSAGGAVSSLMFLHLLYHRIPECESSISLSMSYMFLTYRSRFGITWPGHIRITACHISEHHVIGEGGAAVRVRIRFCQRTRYRQSCGLVLH